MIDTRVIERLRDQLLDRGAPSVVAPGALDLESAAPYARAALARVTPLAELLFLMMAADGHVDERELAAIRGAVRALTDGLLPGATAAALVERFRDALDREGLDERLGEVTAALAADRDDAEVGVMLAAAVALADGHVDARERALFDEVVSHLGVSARRVAELLGTR